MTLDELVANPDAGRQWLTGSCGIAPDEATRLVGVLAEEHAELQTRDRPTARGRPGKQPRPGVSVAGSGLTPVVLETVALIVAGNTLTQIAARHVVDVSTVSRRLSRAATALGTNTIAQTAVEAVRRGLLSVDKHADGGLDNHRARRIRRQLADRHASTCALLQPPKCDCQDGAAP